MGIQETWAAFAAAGLEVKYKEMPNGEKRYSVNLPDGSAWILTIAGKTGGWQNAHYHKGVMEHYVVLHGDMVFAWELPTGEIRVSKYGPNDAVTTKPEISHNVMLLPDSVIMTIKFGIAVGNTEKNGNDWYEARALDLHTKTLGPKELASWYNIRLAL